MHIRMLKALLLGPVFFFALAASAFAASTHTWKKVSYTPPGGEAQVYYYPVPMEHSVRGRDGEWYGVNLYSEPKKEEAYLLKSHLHKLRRDAALTLHIMPEAHNKDFPETQLPRWEEEEIVVGTPEAVPPRVENPDEREVPDIEDGVAIGTSAPQVVQDVGNGIAGGGKYGEHIPDLVDRFMDFSWPKTLPEGRGSFIHPDVAGNETLREQAFKTGLTEWVAMNPEPVAWLYYVLGPGASPPAWVTGSPTLARHLVTERSDKLKAAEKLLVKCLDRWVHSAEGSRPEYCGAADATPQQRTPYGSEENAEWTAKFFADAVNEAMAILHARVPLDVLRGIIGNNDAPPEVPGSPGRRRRPGEYGPPSASFDMDHLFGKWGDPNVFFIDGRKVSMVLRTRRVWKGKPPHAEVKQQVGFFDISNRSDIYGKTFDLQSSGKMTFSLAPGGKKYKLSFSPNGKGDTNISFTRTNGKTPQFGHEGPPQLPTLNSMFRMRAQQALRSGNQTTIGGKSYSVTGQSDSKGSFMFWSEDTLYNIRNGIGDPRTWVPDHVTYVNHKVDTVTENLPGERHIGQIGDKWYSLKWNAAANIWEPGEASAPPVSEPDPAPEGETPQGGDPQGGDPQTGTPPASGFREPLILGDKREFFSDGLAAKFLNENLKALNPELTSKFLFLQNKTNTVQNQGLIILDLTTTGGQAQDMKFDFLSYVGARGGEQLAELILEGTQTMEGGRYLMTRGVQDEKEGFMFMDLKHPEAPGGNSWVGSWNPAGGGNAVRGVKDKSVLHLILRSEKMAKFAAADAATVMVNLDARVQGHEGKLWEINGKPPSENDQGLLAMSFSDDKCDLIWPVVKPGDCSKPEAGNAPGGRGVLFEKVEITDQQSPLGSFTRFEDVPTNFAPTDAQWKRVEPKPADAALYEVVDKSTTSWYLQVRIMVEGSGNPQTRNPFLIFQKTADQARARRILKPGNLNGIAGLVLKAPLSQGRAEFKPKAGAGSLEDAGYWGAYDAPPGKSPNCVGVIAWWGMSQSEACSDCGGAFADGVCKEK